MSRYLRPKIYIRVADPALDSHDPLELQICVIRRPDHDEKSGYLPPADHRALAG
jgi:hypothetical protein